jgi:hypothetical protein
MLLAVVLQVPLTDWVHAATGLGLHMYAVLTVSSAGERRCEGGVSTTRRLFICGSPGAAQADAGIVTLL